jgi:hypothetical protein
MFRPYNHVTICLNGPRFCKRLWPGIETLPCIRVNVGALFACESGIVVILSINVVMDFSVNIILNIGKVLHFNERFISHLNGLLLIVKRSQNFYG